MSLHAATGRYEARGWVHGMAAFIAMTSWQGEFDHDYFAQPAPDPAAFGMPAEEDGAREDPLLSDRSWAISSYQPRTSCAGCCQPSRRRTRSAQPAASRSCDIPRARRWKITCSAFSAPSRVSVRYCQSASGTAWRTSMPTCVW